MRKIFLHLCRLYAKFWFLLIIPAIASPFWGIGISMIALIISLVVFDDPVEEKDPSDYFTEEEIRKIQLEEEVDDDEYLALMAKYLTFSCPKKIDSITTWTGCEVNNSSFIYNYDVNDRWNFYGEIDEEKLKNKIMTQIDKESFHIRSIVATKRNIICRYRHRQIGKVYDIILTTEELRNNNN